MVRRKLKEGNSRSNLVNHIDDRTQISQGKEIDMREKTKREYIMISAMKIRILVHQTPSDLFLNSTLLPRTLGLQKSTILKNSPSSFCLGSKKW